MTAHQTLAYRLYLTNLILNNPILFWNIGWKAPEWLDDYIYRG